MRTYEEIRGYPPDFIVSYHLYAPSEGGRKITYQHLRCDFMYEGYDIASDGIFMIYPEFLGADGLPIEEGIPVPLDGRASMSILSPEMRASVHQGRIEIGTRGYFMEGGRKVGSLEVVQIVGLHANPIN
ncbi:hypothetical protein [Comamonas sp. MYb69]|uniref:hypothetical protein n=1 Tax=Comamonas sp. MYb69 TaxID=1848650 RepID=UPI0030AEC77D